MTLVIDATAGGASANSFVLLTEAQTYMDARLNSSAWSGASTADQNAALVEATREISARNFIGLRSATAQALSWPRQFAENPDSAWPGITWFASTEIPQRVKDATCELAFQFLNMGTTDLAALDTTLNTRIKKIDVIETEYFEPGIRAKGLARFPRVLNRLRPLLTDVGSSVPLVRG